MKITVNGKPHKIADRQSISIPDLIESLEIGKQPVLVELNREAILSREFDRHEIKDGDEVEIIRMVAGG